MESKRDLAINQVPITTKHLSLNYGINLQLLAVTKCKEELPYKPEAFDSRSKIPIAHVNAHNVVQSLAMPYKFLSAQIQTAS